jgi:hypothetical protein
MSSMSVMTSVSIDSSSLLRQPGKWTNAEFMALNRDGHRYELVDGALR